MKSPTDSDGAAGVAEIAKRLHADVKRAVLMCPFNSKGCAIPGGRLAPWTVGNGHMSGGRPALFYRKQNKDFSGGYELTPIGLSVRQYLEQKS